MFPPTRYLAWARRFHGRARFDLATSGIATLSEQELRALHISSDAPGGFPRSATATSQGPCVDTASPWTDLVAAIARYNDVPPDEVVPALGTTHAIWLAYVGLTSPGDELLVEEPAYEPLLRIAEGCGARVVPLRREPGEAFALDPDRMARAMTPRTRAVVVSNLHNPSGVRVPDAVLVAAARVAQRHGATLVVDEVYAAFDDLIDARGVFTRSARKLAPNVVAVSSLTKCYGLGLERIGWLLGPRETAARSHDALTACAGILPASHARVARTAFAQLERLAARTRGLLASKRARVAAWVAKRGLIWSAPQAGLFGFVTLPGRGDVTCAIEAGVAKHDVLVTPGTFFGIPNGFRLAWSIAAGDLDEGLARLEKALDL